MKNASHTIKTGFNGQAEMKLLERGVVVVSRKRVSLTA